MTTPSACTSPEVGRWLPDYIADLLDDSQCETVETHLIDCAHCKGRYLTVLRVRRAAAIRRANMMASSQNAKAASQAAAAQTAAPAQVTVAQTAAAAFVSSGSAVPPARISVRQKGKASGGS